jgi:hypothetical protein
MVTFAEFNERHQIFWKNQTLRIDKLMENTHALTITVGREKRKAEYAKLAVSHAGMIERIRHQKSFELELEEVARELEPFMPFIEAQRKRARKPRGKIGDNGETVGQIIEDLALQPRTRELAVKALWTHFFSELERHVSVQPDESHTDMRKWCYKYDFNGKGKTICYGTFANKIKEARSKQKTY